MADSLGELTYYQVGRLHVEAAEEARPVGPHLVFAPRALGPAVTRHRPDGHAREVRGLTGIIGSLWDQPSPLIFTFTVCSIYFFFIT